MILLAFVAVGDCQVADSSEACKVAMVMLVKLLYSMRILKELSFCRNFSPQHYVATFLHNFMHASLG